MKFIDEKGKIFGKVNILDFTIIVFILLIVFVLVMVTFFPHRIPRAIRRMPQQKEITVKILLDKDRDWLAQYIKIGDGQRGYENNFMAEIINISKAKVVEEAERIIITLRLKANIEQGNFIVYGNNVLRLGEEFKFETKDYFLKGLVYGLEENKNR